MLRSAAEVIGKSPYLLDSRKYLLRAIEIEQEGQRELDSIQRLEKEIGKLSKMEEDAIRKDR